MIGACIVLVWSAENSTSIFIPPAVKENFDLGSIKKFDLQVFLSRSLYVRADPFWILVCFQHFFLIFLAQICVNVIVC